MSTDPKDMLRAAAAAFEARDRDLTAERLRAIVEAAPSLGATWGQVIRLAGIVGEGGLAVAASERRARQEPQNPVPQLEWGGALSRNGDDRGAIEIARALVRDNPDMPAAYYLIGLCYSHLGEADAAVEALQHAIALRPDSGDSWILLSTMKTASASDVDFSTLRSLCARALPGTPETEGGMRLALGKFLEDVGDYAAAFEEIRRGADIYAARNPYDSDADDRFGDELVRTYDKAFVKSLAPSGVSDARAIIIAGLPRSGTTVLQALVTAHSAVKDGGELNFTVPAMLPLSGYTPREINESLARGPRDPWRKFAASYLHLLDARFGQGGRIVDKSLNHSPMLGLVHHMLPEAPLLWIRRDPGDVALSCYRTRLNEGIHWTWSLPAIGRRLKLEDRLHAHWTKLLGDQIMTVSYEDFVAKPDTWIPRILKHCGLADEKGVRDFYKSDRAVHTASMAQVRRPLNASSVGGWKRYEKQMKPFWDAYRR